MTFSDRVFPINSSDFSLAKQSEKSVTKCHLSPVHERPLKSYNLAGKTTEGEMPGHNDKKCALIRGTTKVDR